MTDLPEPPELMMKVLALARDMGPLSMSRVGPLGDLRGLKLIHDAVDELADQSARECGAVGASYNDLGDAWGITRQGARRRWPEAIPARRRYAPCDHCDGTGRT